METNLVIENLKAIFPEISSLERDLEREFYPNPIGINSLFSGVGWLIVEKFTEIEDPSLVFDLIEVGLRNGDDNLKDAIATGLIEALVSKSDEHPHAWQRIYPYLGPLSAAYANDWIRFTETGQI